MSNSISCLQLIKKGGYRATVFALAFLGLMLISSECGALIRIKSTDSGYELLVDKRNCKAPTIADDSAKPLALDHTNDSKEDEQPQVD